ncbi:MAG: hypothetical protein ACP5K7_10860, partial [Verrucomicrobiia bacterium]
MKNYTFIDYATQIYIILTGLVVLFGHNKLGAYWVLLFLIHIGVLLAIHLLVKNEEKLKRGSLFEFLRLYSYNYSDMANLRNRAAETGSKTNMRKTTIELTEEQYFFLKEKA